LVLFSLLPFHGFVLLSFHLCLNACRTGARGSRSLHKQRQQKKKDSFELRVCLCVCACVCVCVENIYGSMSDLLQLVPLHLIVSQMHKKRGQQKTIKNIERIDSKNKIANNNNNNMHSRLLKYLTHDPDRGQTVRHTTNRKQISTFIFFAHQMYIKFQHKPIVKDLTK